MICRQAQRAQQEEGLAHRGQPDQEAPEATPHVRKLHPPGSLPLAVLEHVGDMG